MSNIKRKFPIKFIWKKVRCQKNGIMSKADMKKQTSSSVKS